MDFQSIVDSLSSPACIVSVEKKQDVENRDRERQKPEKHKAQDRDLS